MLLYHLWSGGGGTIGSKPEKVLTHLYHHNFCLASLQVILVPYCCLFCVLSNEMLNVSIAIFFLRRYIHQHHIPFKSTALSLTHISPMRREQNLRFGLLALAVPCGNHIHEMLTKPQILVCGFCDMRESYSRSAAEF